MTSIYYNSNDNKYRYALGELQEPANKILFCFGINPSKATPKKLDPTAKRVELLAKKHGYDSWIILNVSAQRATNPNDMHQTQKHNTKNLRIISNLLNMYSDCSDVLFAYGDLIDKRSYLKKNLCEIINLIKTINYKGNCYCLGKTKSGNARHPLYQKTTSPFVPYSLDGHTYHEYNFLDDNKCIIREYDICGNLVSETIGFCTTH